MKKIIQGFLCLIIACFFAVKFSQAVVIEGTTPSGKFKTVGLTEQGYLQVAVATTQTLSTDTVTGCFSLNASSITLVYPPDGNRKDGIVCNSTSGSSPLISFGNSSVSTGTAKGFPVGSCYSPDNPGSYVGALYGISLSSAQACFIYHR